MAPTNVPRPKSAPTVAAVSELMACTADIGEIVVGRGLPDGLVPDHEQKRVEALESTGASSSCDAMPVPRPRRPGMAVPTPEHAALSTRQAQAPRSARRVFRSSSASAPSPPATLPRNPIWKGQSKSCQAGPSSISEAAAAPATTGWILRRSRTKSSHPHPTSSNVSTNW